MFALSQAEIAHHSEAPRDYSWGYADTNDASDETTQEADGASGAENDSLEPEPDDSLDSMDSTVQKRTRTRAPRSYAAAAE